MEVAIKNRHSVRQYLEKNIEDEKKELILNEINKINKEVGLNIQVCFEESQAFDTFLAHYGKFENVNNYIVLIGKKGNDELIGYWGEHLVLKAQQLGLNTCWVALTYGKNKTKVKVEKGEKIYCTLALGYGKNSGKDHKSKSIEQVSNVSKDTPKWFEDGVKLALFAPTAMNQQKFKFIYQNDQVFAKSGKGFYTKIDLGIAKYHFEIGAKKSLN